MERSLFDSYYTVTFATGTTFRPLIYRKVEASTFLAVEDWAYEYVKSLGEDYYVWIIEKTYALTSKDMELGGKTDVVLT